jgi:hypothetical protein
MKHFAFRLGMIEVHLYGRLRSLVPDSKANEDTILMCEYKENETFDIFLTRLGLQLDDVGDCFINGTLARLTDILSDGDRVGLFPFNMKLIDGGMHLKFHPQRRET